MEEKLKRLQILTEAQKQLVEEDPLKTERQIQRIMKQRSENEFNVEAPIRLKRFLYYGDERPLYQPGDRFIQNKYHDAPKLHIIHIPSLTQLVREYNDLMKKEKEEAATEKPVDENTKKTKQVEEVQVISV
jgi:hypothetical protein